MILLFMKLTPVITVVKLPEAVFDTLVLTLISASYIELNILL